MGLTTVRPPLPFPPPPLSLSIRAGTFGCSGRLTSACALHGLTRCTVRSLECVSLVIRGCTVRTCTHLLVATARIDGLSLAIGDAHELYGNPERALSRIWRQPRALMSRDERGRHEMSSRQRSPHLVFIPPLDRSTAKGFRVFGTTQRVRGTLKRVLRVSGRNCERR